MKVEQVGRLGEGLFALDVTRFTRMDWTWEGARAFADSGDDVFRSAVWGGDIVEVDEVGSRVFMAVPNGAPSPTVGEFVVQPFDFIEALHELYNGQFSLNLESRLARALALAAGEATADPVDSPPASPVLADVWGRSLGYVWGPPGTGKTHTLGEQVAEAIAGSNEKILVVSTTNKATDEAAVSVARALRERNVEPSTELLRRVGSGADITRLRNARLDHILDDGPSDLREVLADLLRSYGRTSEPVDRAALWRRILQVRIALSVGMGRLSDVDSRVVVTTAYQGVRGLAHEETVAEILGRGTPFSTVIADEAGLLSRVSVAALSLWGKTRMLLFGDPRQLSPISRISRVLDPARSRWIARSGLEHLRSGEELGVRLLTKQHRMHPEIRRAVSSFMYDGRLQDAETVTSRPLSIPDTSVVGGPRAIWYVLDDDAATLPQIRAERGPGGKSWVRKRSREIVDRLFRAHPSLRDVRGMFVTPFVAQARDLARWFGKQGLDRWVASTTHAQQGSEADVVLFDTVRAGSTAWSHAEWQRLINVGMSRARHLLILLASRLEMREPFLRPLIASLAPRVLRGSGGKLAWQEVPAEALPHRPSRRRRELDPSSLGAQIESRKAMRPILGAEQQRLCLLPIDGKPRLVRGVAGSGKTAVLAHWLARRVADRKVDGPYWVIYANQALKGLIQSQVDGVWRSLDRVDEFPWKDVEVLHVLELLDSLERERGWRKSWGRDSFDFEARARRLLATEITPRCRAMFVDEAQDCGEATLALLARLVEPADPDEPGQVAINIFYDNAQNVYRRGTPRWVDLGLDMVGRSTVMKESYRSTLPTTEFALNVLYRLEDPGGDPDHAELEARDLVHVEQRNGRRWWRVRFNEVDGPLPLFRQFPDRETEFRALRTRVQSWIRDEGVRPADIRILANGSKIRAQIVAEIEPALRGLGVRVEDRTSARMVDDDDVLLVTTAHSFKGYDAEIVAVPAADRFVANIDGAKGALSHPLYVAMTRARSLLYVSSRTRAPGSPSGVIVNALQSVFEDQRSVPPTSAACTEREEHLELMERIGGQWRDWFQGVAAECTIATRPVLRADGSVAAQPLFTFEKSGRRFACFTEEQTPFAVQELLDLGVRVIRPGDSG